MAGDLTLENTFVMRWGDVQWGQRNQSIPTLWGWIELSVRGGSVHILTLSLSNALAGSRGIIAPTAHTTLSTTTTGNIAVILTSKHPATNVVPLTGRLKLSGGNNYVLSCGNNTVVSYTANRALCHGRLSTGCIPRLYTFTERRNIIVVACGGRNIIARDPRSR